MSSEREREPQFAFAHVLFMDMVGYSKLLIDEQTGLLEQLNQIVRSTQQFQRAEAAGKLMRLPTGDGMALVFFTSPEEPVQCALEISQALQSYPHIRLRMGVHSGPVNALRDVNDRSNVAGTGINLAQRVTQCGDAGHILLSGRVAEDLAQYSHWKPRLHDLGECEVKHGVTVSLVNFYTDKFGNPEVPEKLKQSWQKQPPATIAMSGQNALSKRALMVAAVLAAALVALGVVFWIVSKRAGRIVFEKSLAVLPLENLSDEKENAFFADGIQDDILTSLAKISDLKVISRTSVLQYRGAGAARNLREIARALGVQNILEGSVRRVGNRVLVSVQLIDARNDRHIWAERYDRTVADSIRLQGELATEIAAALGATLSPQEKGRVEAKPTNNPDAYVLYLRAREREQGLNSTTEDAIAAEQLYAQAIALDPAFALAHARASMTNSNIFLQSRDQARKSKARAQAEEALRLSPSLGEAHLALGLCFLLAEKDYAAALEQFSIAATASPNNAEILSHSAFIYRRQGRWREALASFERAQDLDPRNAVFVRQLAATHLMVRDWLAAAADLNRAIEMAPNSVLPRGYVAYLEVIRNGNPAAAKAILSKIPAGAEPDGFVTLTSWALSMLQRDFATAEKILDGFPLEQFFPGQVMDPKSFYQGCTALARGDARLAQRLFEKAKLIFETEVRDHPEDGRRHAFLGLLYAYLDRKEDAIRESRRAVELEPESKDAYHGALMASNLALVYARTGEADQAITLIERLLSTPGAPEFGSPASITLAELRLGWQWDPLRTNPRFQKILAGPEPKTIYK